MSIGTLVQSLAIVRLNQRNVKLTDQEACKIRESKADELLGANTTGCLAAIRNSLMWLVDN